MSNYNLATVYRKIVSTVIFIHKYVFQSFHLQCFSIKTKQFYILPKHSLVHEIRLVKSELLIQLQPILTFKTWWFKWDISEKKICTDIFSTRRHCLKLTKFTKPCLLFLRYDLIKRKSSNTPPKNRYWIVQFQRATRANIHRRKDRKKHTSSFPQNLLDTGVFAVNRA